MRAITGRAAVVGLCAALTVGAAATAHAGFTPAWSYVPASVRSHLAARAGGTLYLPARTPLFYRYRSGARVAGGRLTVTFTNRVRIRQGLWKWTRQSFQWQVLPLAAGKACTSWATVAQTYQLDGSKVYWNGAAVNSSAWRCAVDRNGTSHVLVATGGGKLSGVGLGLVVASGLDVSRRTSAIRVALTVAPATVRRGGTVLASGVAGGCTAGDTVTVLSRAFSAAHSFAGVPAVLAQVGSAGRFSTRTRIPAARAPGRYVVTARCGGGNLGVSAHVTVTR
jgi:hypothetical protein